MSPWLSDRLLSSQSDERLAALASAGSERAFAAIVQRYRRPLMGFARNLAPSAEAEDLVQQTFMSALAAIQTGVEVRHLRGWLHQILRNAAMRAARAAELPAGSEQIEWVSESAQQIAELRLFALEALAALAQLPARQQQAMVATAIQGQSRAEVAQLLGLSEGAVRQLVHRARESLRAAVTAITPYPLAQALAGSSGGGVADVVAGAGAGSAGALAVKLGAVLASGVVATGLVTSNIHGRSHSTHHPHAHATTRGATASDPPQHGGAETRLAALHGAGVPGATRLAGGESGRDRGGGPGPSGSGSDGGPGTSSDGSSGGPSLSSGSSDGDGSGSGSSGGPSATTATSGDGGSGSSSGGSGSGDGGTTTTSTTSGSDGGGGSGSSDGGTTTTTTTTTSGSDGGISGGSGSGDTTTTTSTTDGH